jgi:hypothetical protein
MLVFLLFAAKSIGDHKVFYWQFACDQLDLSNSSWTENHCFNNISFPQICKVFDSMICLGRENFLNTMLPLKKEKVIPNFLHWHIFFGYLELIGCILAIQQSVFLNYSLRDFFNKFLGWLDMNIASNSEEYYVSKPFPILREFFHQDAL